MTFIEWLRTACLPGYLNPHNIPLLRSSPQTSKHITFHEHSWTQLLRDYLASTMSAAPSGYAKQQPHGFTNRIERVAIVGVSLSFAKYTSLG
jgi:hypothetical protein